MEQSKRILIADDEDTNYKVFEYLIEKNTEFSPIRARNGIEAVHFAMVDYRINLVLMDIKMPLLDGIEATKRIKTIRPHLPIIAVTAFAQLDDKEQMLKAGCEHYLTKPVAPDKLMETIGMYLK